uniref:Uncharacterized protein n=1 Tax=Helianthus annuus TaxID=4232 RepID=A0A251VP24_HELAN
MVCVSSKPSPLSHLHRRRRYPISCLRYLSIPGFLSSRLHKNCRQEIDNGSLQVLMAGFVLSFCGCLQEMDYGCS